MSYDPMLAFHLGSGIVALLSGTAALGFRKGAQRHRMAGNMFVLSMLGLSGSGTYLGFMNNEALNGLQGVLTFYLTATAWWALKRRHGEGRILDLAALIVPLAVAAGLATYGVEAASMPTGSLGGYPAAAYFVFGSIALFFAVGDVRMLMRSHFSGVQRIARHLGRMSYALFTASSSFFLGQMQLFPESVRNPALLAIPSFLPLLFLAYWLWRVRVRRDVGGIVVRDAGGIDVIPSPEAS